MTAEAVRASPGWLRLREAADAAARPSDLVDHIRPHLQTGRVVIHDLGCGTGSMGGWLAPRLSGRQHWILYDRDAALLAQAAAALPVVAADGAAVTIETRQLDTARLDPVDVAGADLITASALLDMVSADKLERLVMTCADPGWPVRVTISVIGRVDLTSADPLDARIAGAINAHLRRLRGRRRLLGPDAVGSAVDAFTQLGADVLVRQSPRRLGAAQSALAIEWLTGWVRAARERQPELSTVAADYDEPRLAKAAAGRLNVMVYHHDLLALFR